MKSQTNHKENVLSQF